MSLLNNKFLKNLILITIFLYTSIGYAKTPYIEGKNLQNLLSSNEITIKTEEGLTHAYQFNSDMTYEVFSYPKRNLIGKGSWEMYPGYQVDVSYRLPDHIYLKGYKSELRDPYFIFVSDPKIIIIPQNLMNPNAYDVAEIISVLSKTKVKQIINERIAKERAEKEKLAKIKAEQERIKQEKLAKKRAEEEKLAKIKAEQERIQAEKDRVENERLAKIKAEEQKEQTIFYTIFALVLIVIVYFIYRIRVKKQNLDKLKKAEEHQKFLDENLGKRLIYEYSKITKSKEDIKSWNKKNNEHLVTLKQFLIENLKQSNKSLINNFKNLSNEIEKYNQEIAKEKNAYKDLNKKYPFINTIIKTRGES